MRNLVILLSRRRIQGYFSEDDYKNIISIIVEIQIKSLRANNLKCSYGDAMKEVFYLYANHYELFIKGTNDVKPYYFKDSFFEDVFKHIERAEKYGLNTLNNQSASFVIQDAFKIMDFKKEYAKKRDIEEIRDRNEQFEAIVDYLKGSYDEYQESKKEEDSKSAEKNNNKDKEIENSKHAKT